MVLPWKEKAKRLPSLRGSVLLLGETGVGKSSLLRRFSRDRFNADGASTIGVEFASRALQLRSANVKLQCWDLAGQERFRAVCRSYYRGSVGALLVFDLSREETFAELPFWLEELQRYNGCAHAANAPLGPPVLLVGNKADLAPHERAVSDAAIAAFVTAHRIPAYCTVSAKTGDGVEAAFRELAQQLLLRVEEAERSGVELPIQLTVESALQTPQQGLQGVPSADSARRNCC